MTLRTKEDSELLRWLQSFDSATIDFLEESFSVDCFINRHNLLYDYDKGLIPLKDLNNQFQRFA